MSKRFLCDSDDADREAEKFFGYKVPKSERRQLCDGCYTEFVQWAESLSPEVRAELNALSGC